LVLDIKDANNHILHKVHIWILNPTRSKSLTIANRSEDTWGEGGNRGQIPRRLKIAQDVWELT